MTHSARAWWITCAAMLAGLPATAAAEPATAPAASQSVETRRLAEKQPVKPGDASLAEGWWQTVGALAVVIVVIVALRIVLRRLAAPGAGLAASGPIQVLARAQVLPRQHLLLVQVKGRALLLGSGPNGLTTLSEFADGSGPDRPEEKKA